MVHFPVLLSEAIHALSIQPGGKYIDCTFGRGGHSGAILKCLDKHGKLLALDRDQEAISSAEALVMVKDRRLDLQHSSFSELEKLTANKGWVREVDGVIMDLGVSSPQLDQPERGFSFIKDGPLDMRMDGNSGLTAAQWLHSVTEQELIKVLFTYGEERFARRIARAIIQQRDETAIVTTRQLASLIEAAVPVKEKHKHPATRSFQAIRIEINHELEELKVVLNQAVRILKPGGRLVVIAFHSLEDRIVKRFIRDESRGKYSPGKLPLQDQGNEQIRLKKIGKVCRANQAEVVLNVRSRSAIMRVAQRAG